MLNITQVIAMTSFIRARKSCLRSICDLELEVKLLVFEFVQVVFTNYNISKFHQARLNIAQVIAMTKVGQTEGRPDGRTPRRSLKL